MDRPIATGIINQAHLVVFDEILAERLENINLDVLLVNMIDTVPSPALPSLARQFHVTGWEGWNQALDDLQKRELIKRSIEAHRFKGTPWSIKQALLAVGFGGCTIIEGVDRFYNGEIDHDGSNTYGSQGWAKFKVIIDLGNDRGITPAQDIMVTALVNEYKNVRSWLVGLAYMSNLVDFVPPITDQMETITIIQDDIVDNIQLGIRYDGVNVYNGNKKHNCTYDAFEIKIIYI